MFTPRLGQNVVFIIHRRCDPAYRIEVPISQMLNTGKQKLPKTRDNIKMELIVWVAESYGFKAPQERLGELQLRTMEKIGTHDGTRPVSTE